MRVTKLAVVSEIRKPDNAICQSETRPCKTLLARACVLFPKSPHCQKFHRASTFIRSTFFTATFLEEPRRISKVCCSLQQILPRSPATVACDSSKPCRSRPQQNMPRVRQNLPECYGSNLALAAAIPRGLRFCRGGLSATLSHFSSWRNRV